MLDTADEFNDSHLCIKCNETIVGLENYITHRKNNCGNNNKQPSLTTPNTIITATTPTTTTVAPSSIETTQSTASSIATPTIRETIIDADVTATIQELRHDVTSDTINTNKEISVVNTTNVVTNTTTTTTTTIITTTTTTTTIITTTTTNTTATTTTTTNTEQNKSLSENYDYNYELGADLFFSSLELQSSAKVKSITSATTAKKPINQILTRKATAAILAHHDHEHDIWINTNSHEKLLKDVNDIGGLLRDPFSVADDDHHHHHHHHHDHNNDVDEDDADHHIGVHHDNDDDMDDDDYDNTDNIDDNDNDDDGDDDDYDELDEDYDDDVEDEDYIVPLKTHTGGKWKPIDLHHQHHHQKQEQQQQQQRDQQMQQKQPQRAIENILPSTSTHHWTDSENQLNQHHPWDINTDNDEFNYEIHPPPTYTKGKWVPGTKIIKLDYKPDPEPEKIFTDQYWCSTCNRKLASRIVYERHLKSNLHKKRSQPETELERASRPLPLMPHMDEICKRTIKPSIYLNDKIYATQLQLIRKDNDNNNKKLASTSSASSKVQCPSPPPPPPPPPQTQTSDECKKLIAHQDQMTMATNDNRKRKRRRIYIKCELCKSRVLTYRYGKHLISIYHYRFMLSEPEKSFHIILDNIHDIILHSPFQCQPCRFYANTEDMFLRHWNTKEHTDLTEGPGRFWCNFCKFECEDNNQMRRHLVDEDHRDVVQLINRSVPIIIRKRSIIRCPKCYQEFYLNMELRKHSLYCQSTLPISGTASNRYQSKYTCSDCKIMCKSRISLQKHNLKKHMKKFYFCGPCDLNFDTSALAKKHRTTTKHKIQAAHKNMKPNLLRKCLICNEILLDILQLKEHLKVKHPEEKYTCTNCGKSFILPQELSRHVRDKKCINNLLTVKVSESVGATLLIETEATKETERLELPSSSIEQNTIVKSIEVSENEGAPDNVERKIDVWTCKECIYTSKSESEHLLHETLHKFVGNIKMDKIPCPKCNKSFRKLSLRCHLRKHTNERIYKCQMCSLSFIRKSNLRDHMENIHLKNKKIIKSSQSKVISADQQDARTFICKVCNKKFQKKRILEQHLHCHRNEMITKSFSCTMENCLFSGRSAAEVRNHMISHSNEKKFHCSYEGCKYKGKSMNLLKRHTKQQHDVNQNKVQEEKQLNCQNCDFKTNILSHLKRHRMIHTGEKPFKCPYCEYSCNNSENLRKHVISTNKHPGRYLYECKYCVDLSKQFLSNNSKAYKAHLHSNHSSSSSSSNTES